MFCIDASHSTSVFQFELLLVVDINFLTKLDLDQFQLRFGNDRMAAACGHGDDIACLHVLLHPVHDGLALACNDRPDLIPVLVAVVVHPVACVQSHFDGHGFLINVNDLEVAPGFFREHDLVVEHVDEGLDVAGLLLIGHQNAFRAGRDYHILQTHAEDGHIQLVDYMDIDGVTVLDAAYLIPFKAKAWMDLTDRKAAGEHVDSKNIKKHKNDVFRLTELLDPTVKIVTPSGVYEDMQKFVDRMENETVDVKQLGLVGRTKEQILQELVELYALQ